MDPENLINFDRFEVRAPRAICGVANGDDGGGAGGDGGGGDGIGDDVRDFVLRTVNAAVSNQLSRKLPAAIQSGVSGAIAPLQEMIEKLSSGGAGAGDDKQKGGGPDPEVAKLRQEHEAMKATLAAERKKAEDERKASQVQQTQAQLRDLLAKAGVEPLRMKGALAVLGEGVQRSDDGQLSYRVQRTGYHEDLALQDGIREWLATDEGKSYLAPRADAGGTGNVPARGQLGGPRVPKVPTDPKVAKQQKVQQARESLRTAIGAALSGAQVTLGGGGDEG